MMPKPDVEWVKTTLERLNIRVVNDRPGRRKKREISDLENNRQSASYSANSQQKMSNTTHVRDQAFPTSSTLTNSPEEILQSMGGRANNSSFPDYGDATPRQFSNQSQYGSHSQQSSYSSSVLAPLQTNAYNMGNSVSGYQHSANGYGQDTSISRPEAGRLGYGSSSTQHQLANLVFGSTQHYEVLKEHHANLLRELQETTALMNMYFNNNQQNVDNISNLRMQNRESRDPYHDQSAFGSNQFYPVSTGGRDSFGQRGNFHGNSSSYSQLEASRRDSLQFGMQQSSVPYGTDAHFPQEMGNTGRNAMLPNDVVKNGDGTKESGNRKNKGDTKK